MDQTLLFLSTSNPDPFFFLLSQIAVVLTPAPQGGDRRLTWEAQDFSPQGWALSRPWKRSLCRSRMERG